MRIKLFVADAAGCGFYRMRAPGEAAARLTSDVDIVFVSSVEDEESLEVHLDGPIGNTHVTGVSDPKCDVLVLQRPMNRELVESIPLIQQWGTAVVVEVDDDFDRVHPNNPAWRGIQPQLSPNSNVLWFNLAVQLADLVTVSTPALEKRYGQHGRVRVLPNYIPESYLEVERDHENESIELGWPGNAKVHPGDLKIVGSAVTDTLQKTDANFRAIGTPLTFTELSVPESRQVLVSWVPIDEYPRAVAQIDVGIVPLDATPFNRAKSWLKGLEFAALGVPFVASDLPEYRKLSRLGAGLLAGHHGSWTDHLCRLVEDSELRATLAEQGRNAARNLTIEKHAERWLQAWADAAASR